MKRRAPLEWVEPDGSGGERVEAVVETRYLFIEHNLYPLERFIDDPEIALERDRVGFRRRGGGRSGQPGTRLEQ
ncbi:MAG: hypothetical protein LH606_08635 [Cytophagaceae bacterium]|nr:hypothetical protein [Cytophagaceae bacterium]